MRKSVRLQSGVTLPEVLVTLLIAITVSAVAFPSFRQLMGSNRARTTAYSLVAGLTLARNEAVKRNANVSMMPAVDGWQTGWNVQANGQVIDQQFGLSKVVVVGPTGGVTFDAYGRIANAPVQFLVMAETGLTRCVMIDMSGHPNLLPKEGRNGNCGY